MYNQLTESNIYNEINIIKILSSLIIIISIFYVVPHIIILILDSDLHNDICNEYYYYNLVMAIIYFLSLKYAILTISDLFCCIRSTVRKSIIIYNTILFLIIIALDITILKTTDINTCSEFLRDKYKPTYLLTYVNLIMPILTYPIISIMYCQLKRDNLIR